MRGKHFLQLGEHLGEDKYGWKADHDADRENVLTLALKRYGFMATSPGTCQTAFIRCKPGEHIKGLHGMPTKEEQQGLAGSCMAADHSKRGKVKSSATLLTNALYVQHTDEISSVLTRQDNKRSRCGSLRHLTNQKADSEDEPVLLVTPPPLPHDHKAVHSATSPPRPLPWHSGGLS